MAKKKLCEASGSSSGVTEDSDLLDVTPCSRFGVSYDPQPASGEASRNSTNSLRSFETWGNTNPATEYHIAEDQNPTRITHTALLVVVTGIPFIMVIWILTSSVPGTRKIRLGTSDIPRFQVTVTLLFCQSVKPFSQGGRKHLQHTTAIQQPLTGRSR